MATQKAARPPKLKTGVEALITGVAVVVGLILLNVLVSGVRTAKLDLTENEIYTLSQASRDMVRALDEKINIKAYFGNVPVTASDKQDYIEALLAEYADASGGKITFEKIDPTGDPKLQEELKKDGVDKIRLLSVEDDKREQVKIYFHVVFSYLDKKEVWKPEGGFSLEGLEYEYSSIIKRIAKGKKKVCVTTGFGEPAHTQALASEKIGLGDLYEVTTCDWSKEPGSIDAPDVVIVNGPTKVVSEAAKYHLDQRVMQGKPTLFAIRGMRWEGAQAQPGLPPELQQDQPYTGFPNDHGLDELLAHYGFKVDANTILDGRNSAYGTIPPGQPQALARGFFPLAQSLQAGPRQMLQGIDFVVAPWSSSISLVGPLEKGAPAGTEVVPVLRTLPTAVAREGLLPITREFRLQPNDKDKKGPHLVAVAASGKWSSFFADKPVPEGATAPGGQPAEGDQPAIPGATIKESPERTRLIVLSMPAFIDDVTLGDVRFHQDRTYVNGFLAAHGLVDWLAEDSALVSARNKVVERPLEDVEKTKRTLLKLGNIVGPPVVLILFGVGMWLVRDHRRRHIQL